MKQRITYFFAGIFLIALQAQSQTILEYYVDGSQTINGDGTSASPWNRIWYAVNRTRDTTKDAVVYIKAGTYTIDSTDYLTQLYIGANNGGANGKYLTLQTYPGDEGKVFIDGSRLATTTYDPNMLIISGAKYVKVKNLVFRNLMGTNGYVINVQNAQNIEISNCVFDTLRWTNTSAEYGYPTVNNNSHYIYPFYLANNSSVTISNDTLRNSALGWGEFVRDAGGNSGITTSGLITTNVTPIASGYYVALTGNDTSGSGSAGKPWRTPKRALELAGIDYSYSPAKLINSPVTIYLRGGRYKPAVHGLFIGSIRGGNNQWFTLRNYPGETAVLDGSNITEKFSALISISDAKFVKIEGLELTKMTNDSALQYAAPSVGTKDTRFGISVTGKCANIIIKKNKIYDMAWTRNLTKQKTPTAFDNLNPLIVLGTTDTTLRNVIIDSNTVYENVPGYSEAIAINGNVDSFAVTNNLVFDNANIGILAAGNYPWVVDDPVFTVTAANNYSKNGFIKGNTVYRNISPIAVSAGIYLDGSRYVLVEDNLCYKNGVGISLGNEPPNSISGYHTVNSNVCKENLSAGLYYGSTTATSWVEYCTVMNNTIKDNYVIDSALRARANNQYGVTDPSQRYTEVNIYRLRNSMFKQNTIESLSNIVLGLYLTQSADTLKYNSYYVISEDACQTIFVEDKNNDGAIVLPGDSIYTNFHQYANRTGFDQESECEGEAYNSTGCSTAGRPGAPVAATLQEEVKKIPFAVYPNPAVNDLFINLNMQNAGKVRIELFDLPGRMVVANEKQLTGGNHQLNLKGLKQKGIKTGIYLLRITTPGMVRTTRVLIQ